MSDSKSYAVIMKDRLGEVHMGLPDAMTELEHAALVETLGQYPSAEVLGVMTERGQVFLSAADVVAVLVMEVPGE